MLLRKLSWAVLVAAIAVCGAAMAAPKPVYGPPAPWVDVAAIPDAPPADGQALQTLLDDNQSRLGTDQDVFYNRRVYKVLKPEGLQNLTTQSLTWNPETETLAIHAIRIVRDGKVIDLLGHGKDVLVLRRETDLERAMLDGRLTATRRIDGLQVGDVLDVSWSWIQKDPVMKGHSQDQEGMTFSGPAGRYRVHVSWPQSDPVRWTATEGFGKPQLTSRDGRVELLLDAPGAKAPKPPIGAPGRFQRLGDLQITSFASWQEVSALMAPLYAKAATLKPGSDIRAEAAAIAAKTSDPKARAFEALKLVEDKTRYFFVGTNEGGFVPAAADDTWTRRFGDCKGKTVLLLSLLKELGIDAEPTLVSTWRGDGLDQTLPSLDAFDHVIVRASIGGKVYWLDGTRTGDLSGLDDLRPPPWRWALPLTAAGGPLEKIEQAPLSQPEFAMDMRLDASKGFSAPAPARIEMLVRGDAAVAMRQSLTASPKEDVIRYLRQSMSSSMSFIDIDDVSWGDGSDPDVFRLVITGKADLDWRENPDLHVREYRLPQQRSEGASAFPRRDPGPNQDAPFVVPFPLYVQSLVEVVLPNGGQGFTVRGPSTKQTIAGFEIVNDSRLEGGVARFQGMLRTVAPESSASDADAFNKLLRRMKDDDAVIREAPPGGSSSAAR